MNSRAVFIGTLGVIALALTSCYKTEVLSPVEIPEMLQSPIVRLEVFDNGVIACVSDGGIFVQYAEDDWEVYAVSEVSNFYLINWENVRMFCDPQQNVWAIDQDGEYVAWISRNSVETYYRTHGAPYQARGYGMSPEGKLYRADYWGDGFNADAEWVYYLRLSVWENNLWKTVNTPMEVPANNYDHPSIAFDASGTLYICSNPVYKVTGADLDNLEYEKNLPNTSGFSMKGIRQPFIGNNTIQGFDRDPGDEDPIIRAFTFNLVSGIARELFVKDECSYTDEAIGPVKVLSQDASGAMLFVKVFTNNYSENQEILGYLAKLDPVSKNCSLRAIRSGKAVPFSNNITDIDINEATNELLIGTTRGLMIYDLGTDELSTYLERVLQLDIE